jgi:hypothetical protein
MPQLIPGKIVVKENGELHISIDLNININGTPVPVKEIVREEEPELEIPAFNPAPKIKFGKEKK